MNDRGGVRAWILAFVAAAGVGFGGLIGIGCAIGANACPFTDEQPLTTTQGRAIYEARCMVCHGADGTGARRGGQPIAPSLVTGQPAAYSLETLEQKISRGRPFAGMPRFEGVLTPAQIEAVARYVRGLRGDR